MFAATALGGALALLQPASADYRHAAAPGYGMPGPAYAFSDYTRSCARRGAFVPRAHASQADAYGNYPPPPGFWPPPGSASVTPPDASSISRAAPADTQGKSDQQRAVVPSRPYSKSQRGEGSQTAPAPAQWQSLIDVRQMQVMP